jgi:hypothetical protein
MPRRRSASRYHRGGKGIRLDNHRRSRLAIVTGCRNCDHVATLQWASNSETDSVQRKASNSRERSRPATCLAIRFWTVFERASGTTNRNSRKPRARRLSRIAFIRSAVCATAFLHFCNALRAIVQTRASMLLDLKHGALAASGDSRRHLLRYWLSESHSAG